MSAAELFAGAGQKAGIEVWRIEALKPVRQGKEAHDGKLCTGDSYIVLHSIPLKSGGFDYNLHFWLGEESSQDEKGTAVRAQRELKLSPGRRFGAPRRAAPPQAPLTRGAHAHGGGEAAHDARPRPAAASRARLRRGVRACARRAIAAPRRALSRRCRADGARWRAGADDDRAGPLPG